VVGWLGGWVVEILELVDLAATAELGRALAAHLFPGAVIALNGPLGAGKTELTRAVVTGLGGDPRLVCSPTFTLVHEYQAQLPVYHFDAYRLQGEAEFFDIGCEEYFRGDGVCLVEWADRVPGCLPADRLTISLAVTADTSRRAELEATGERHQRVLSKCLAAVRKARASESASPSEKPTRLDTTRPP
jgi:tRNA threonylcarbamoyladenosine biosynthesis protein TsaE